MDKYCFQYCQKIVVFSRDKRKILLCKRKGEEDYDGTFSFIGGKMETGDESILEGLRREKNEEVGEDFKIKIFPTFTHNVLFRKKNGSSMILPHYLAVYESGEIKLNEEYSEFKWVEVDKLAEFEPKIPNVDVMATLVNELHSIGKESDFILI
jgi:ADP-ribose pyrophosphatase YjhB (NUDIX family)